MIKFFLHIVLLSYAALIFKPVLPYVNDFISHAFFYARHMATVHVENGQYHLHFETAQNSQQEKDKEHSTPSAPKKDTTATEYTVFFSNNEERLFGNLLLLVYLHPKNDAAVNCIIQKNYPPPRC